MVVCRGLLRSCSCLRRSATRVCSIARVTVRSNLNQSYQSHDIEPGHRCIVCSARSAHSPAVSNERRQNGSAITMALSLSNFLVTLLLLLPHGLIPGANAATRHFDWNIGWVNANPDGQAERPVIGINGQWPIPLLNITKGDRVIVNLHNQVRQHN